MSQTTQRIRVNGIELNVLIAGAGPDVLLVHGFPDTHTIWRRQVDVLVAAGYRVIAPDTRGCGESDMPSQVSDYRLELLVADLVGLLDALGIGKVRLVGHDWGSAICWRMVMAHPERVDRYMALAVGHPAAYSQGGLVQKLRGYYILFLQLRGVAEFLLTCCNWWLFRKMAGAPEQFPEVVCTLSRPGRLTAHINYYRANVGLIIPREYPAVDVPVFGIWGSGDHTLVERQMTASENYVNAAWRYARIDGANHWMQFDAAERFNPLLLDFLQQA